MDDCPYAKISMATQFSLTYCRIKIGNYFSHTHVNYVNGLSHIAVLCMYNHKQKIKFILSSFLRYSQLAAFNDFGHAWPHSLQMTEQICNFYESLTTC